MLFWAPQGEWVWGQWFIIPSRCLDSRLEGHTSALGETSNSHSAGEEDNTVTKWKTVTKGVRKDEKAEASTWPSSCSWVEHGPSGQQPPVRGAPSSLLPVRPTRPLLNPKCKAWPLTPHVAVRVLLCLLLQTGSVGSGVCARQPSSDLRP